MSSFITLFSVDSILLLLFLGAVVGIVAGLFGVGGGLVIVPVLIWSLPLLGVEEGLSVHMAVGTSLATIVFTSIAAVRAHHRRGAVVWRYFLALTPGILLGAWLGGMIAGGLEGESLRRLFALFLLIVAFRMFREAPLETRYGLVSRWQNSGVGLGIGAISALVGIGGGTLTVPYLNGGGVEVRRAVATSSACGLPIALAGTLSFVWVGWGAAGLPAGSSGYVYWPVVLIIVVTSTLLAPAGASLAHRLSPYWLKRIFALFLLFVSIRLLFS
ncbi:sulfite exporter TauE/SafE family protein [Candidatus Endoriftia persephone]|jgi:uncharacterized membrane protein YfcA|uniref:Probable membrane transporter protein n=3 Tax=Gammaproteobacteria TaxID=1236 RepID=G2FCN2_9GAMM|nr:sulfite exporter TauE/SafE family protein [Candidatus Endoriftia persephone]EGV51170.1 protein of unknown function DUF81 [endosymbiont of Riftia pachyptila (vent Ph05)]EGW55595.1 hypothetical protein TevJSym_ac01590 [endosymbiont of Tevnia jerichonana (vent Tica)]USF86739.1 sulfite exporter TauE/SafE family protein [Candidatus Endoriftia persephone]